MIEREKVLQLEQRMNEQVIGQQELVRMLIIALLCDGHVLLEGLPGLAKTRAVRELARHVEGDYRRIQFTPDLLPSDITGSEIYQQNATREEDQFRFRPGPVFGNIILADEINRASARVQSALLEAMEERHVTVAGKTWPLPGVFMVLATQNPVDQEGTWPLPEAQLDRFLMKVLVDYPTKQNELKVMQLVRGGATAKISAAGRLRRDERPPSRDLNAEPAGDSRLLAGYFCHPCGADGRRVHRQYCGFKPSPATGERYAGRLSELWHQPSRYPCP